MKLTVEINCDNAAFGEDIVGEVGRILVEAARPDRLARALVDIGGVLLFDSNGNAVGKMGHYTPPVKKSNRSPLLSAIPETRLAKVLHAEMPQRSWVLKRMQWVMDVKAISKNVTRLSARIQFLKACGLQADEI